MCVNQTSRKGRLLGEERTGSRAAQVLLIYVVNAYRLGVKDPPVEAFRGLNSQSMAAISALFRCRPSSK